MTGRAVDDAPLTAMELIVARHACGPGWTCAACPGAVPFPCGFLLMARVALRLHRAPVPRRTLTTPRSAG